MNAHPTRSAFALALRSFINDELPRVHSRLKESPNVACDTPLFTKGLIDSLAILHLIAWVETATGRTIAIEEVVMKHFETIDAITAKFGPPVEALPCHSDDRTDAGPLAVARASRP